MSSWIPSFSSLPGLLKRSRSDTDAIALRPALQHKGASLDLGAVDEDVEVQGASDLLNQETINLLTRNYFPPRLNESGWRLFFSTSNDGFSLNSIYRRFQDENKDESRSSPTLLAIEDQNANVFGAFISGSIKLEETFYGTGESFLFSVKPKFRVYKWSGENQHFTQGTVDHLVIGSSEGHFGLWIDSSLYKGRSQSCTTYNNEPLSPQGDFTIKTIECWTFL